MVLLEPTKVAPRTAKRVPWEFLALFGLGLLLRLLLLAPKGTGDVDYFVLWGAQLLHKGLAAGSPGLPYFPAENQLLAFAAWIAQAAHVSGYLAIKLVNLAFDLGIFGVLWALLAGWKVNPRFALLYWLHPYVIVTFALGYIDFHQAFCAVLAVWFVERYRRPLGYLAAGGFLGLALLMKGQSLVIVFMVVAFILLRIALRRDWRGLLKGPVLLLVLPLAEFAGYSLYLHAGGLRIRYLELVYQNIGNNPGFGLSLTAHMPNVWYPVAYLLSKGRGETYLVIDPGYLHTVASVVTLGLLLAAVYLIARRYMSSGRFSEFLYLAALGTFILPMTLTRMHENYFFIGAVFAFALLSLLRDRTFRTSMHVFLGVQALNLFGLYGLGDPSYTSALGPLTLLHDAYKHSGQFQLLASLVSIASFVVAIYSLRNWIGSGMASKGTLS